MSKKRYFFIGDIHGCSLELKKLLVKINPKANDAIYCVGDIVNKGPDSSGSVDLLMEYKAKAVMGNHDLLVYFVHCEKDLNIPSPIKLKKNHYDLYNSLTEKERFYLYNLPFYYTIPEINTILVHAGLKPNTTLDQHTHEEITCLRIVDPITKQFVKRDKFGLPWYYYYKGKETIVYGHSAAQSIKINKNTIGIDTGCLYGGKLTAYILPDNKFISVNAETVYEDYTQGGKYRMPR